MHDIPGLLDIPLVDSLTSTQRSNMEKSIDNPDSSKQDVEQLSQISSSSPDAVNNADELDFKLDAKLILGILVSLIQSKDLLCLLTTNPESHHRLQCRILQSHTHILNRSEHQQ
jgi:hypothetical protein